MEFPSSFKLSCSWAPWARSLVPGILAVCLAPPSLAVAPPRLERVDHLSTEDGLSHTSVWDLHQDATGFIWLATQDGLNRYDGYRFKVYRSDPADPRTLSTSEVLEIYEDRQGFLWLRTRNSGLNRFDPTSESFTRYRQDAKDPTSLSHNVVRDVHQDANGTMWIATADGLNRLLPAGAGFERFLDGVNVRTLTETTEGELWASSSSGLYRIDRSTHAVTEYRHDPDDPQSLGHDETWGILQDSHGALWIGTDGGGLNRFDRERGTFTRFRHDPDDPASLHHDSIPGVYGVHENRHGELWILTGGGLDRFDRDRQTFVHISEGGEAWEIAAHPPTELLEDRHGELWLSTLGAGLKRLDRQAGALVTYHYEATLPHGLSTETFLTMLEDRSGVLWFAGYGGLDKFDPRREQFRTYTSAASQGGLSGDSIWPILEDHAGMLWVGTYENGLNRLDRQRGETLIFRHDPGNPNSIAHDTVTALSEDAAGNLWIGSSGGLDKLDPSRQRFTHFRHDPDNADTPSSDLIIRLLEDRTGRLWLGTPAGVDRFDRESGRFDHYRHDPDDPTSLSANRIYNLYEDHAGVIWAGSSSDGLSYFDPDEDRFFLFQQDSADPNDLSKLGIASLYEDAAATLWVGTYDAGLAKLSPERREIRRYRVVDGLPNDSILGILPDDDGHLWMNTNNGVSRFDPRTETFRNYDVSDGLQGNVFSSGAYFRGPSGELFFGGVEGLNAFFPDQISDDPLPPPVVITDFKLFYESVRPWPFDPSSPLLQSILATRQLTLDHRQYVFGFELAALTFASPGKNRYAYRLEGFDRDWIEVDAQQRSVQYSNLDAGQYTFRARASNKDGVWNDEGVALQLTVLPPWWKTWWAQTLYAMTFILLLVGYNRWQEAKVARERAISAQLREVDRLKDQFLANTSHELRTPLYGIIGLAESLLDGVSGELNPQASSNLEMIAASGRRLSSLVNDILDFSTLSQKSLELDMRPVDLRSLVDLVLTLSRPLIGDKDLRLINAVAHGLPAAHADEDRLQQILHHLVANAIKFTESGAVEVSATCEEGRLVVRVADTGIGIDSAKLEKIFEVFEQADASTERAYGGTGLGLAVTRQLVAMHGGAIWAESQNGRGSIFFFTVPISEEKADSLAVPRSTLSRIASVRDEAAMSAILQATAASAALPSSVEPSKRSTEAVTSPSSGASTSAHQGIEPDEATLLVIDDEPIIRLVLLNYLTSEGYRVLQATNGPDGLRVLEQDKVDLVLLDIMMPKMSGYEVCRLVREKRTVEQLPVIFLTAKNQISDLIAGFSAGGNDYLTKPITKGELLARVRTHLQLLAVHRRQREQVKILSGLLPICGNCKKIRDDDGYWNQLEEYIDAHSEASFTHGICPDCLRKLYPDWS